MTASAIYALAAAIAIAVTGTASSAVYTGVEQTGTVAYTLASNDALYDASKVVFAGDATVAFMGDGAYTCGVYGYGPAPSATDGGTKTLDLTEFTGTLSGAIGGFDAIAFEGDTAATLSGSTIDNDEWKFYYTGRTFSADTAALTLNDGTFTGDSVTLALDATDAPQDWNIATGVADTAIGFDYTVYVSGDEQTFVDGRIASGDYAGWGFALEDSTLKFKHLA